MTAEYWADHLLALTAHGDRILNALYCARHTLIPHEGERSPVSATSSPSAADVYSKGGSPDVAYTYNGAAVTPSSPSRPALERIKILNDPAIAEVLRKLVKKFPESIDLTKDPKHQAFRDAQVQILAELKVYYKVLVASMEYIETGLSALQESINLVSLSFDTNPELVDYFLDLLVSHVSAVYMLAAFGQDRKIIAAVYGKAYQIAHGMQDPDYAKLAKHILYYDKPLFAMQESLGLLASKILTLLLEMKPDLELRLCVKADSFRKMAILSLTPEMSGIKAPDPDERHLQKLTEMGRQHRILILGFLVAGPEMVKLPAYMDVLKQTLTYGHVVPLVRNEMLNIAGEFEASFKALKKFPGSRTIVSETVTANAASNQLLHKDRRDYLRHQLKQMTCLTSDSAILCLKFPVVTSALGFARDEILWYFNHLELDTGKKRSKKDVRTLDVGILELIWLMKDLANKVAAKGDAIKDHIADQIVQFYGPQLLRILDNTLTPDIQEEPYGILLADIQRVITDFVNGHFVHVLEAGDLQSLRVNWLRFQVASSLPSAGGVANISDISWFMTNICDRTRWLDQFEVSLVRLSGLKELCFYQSALHEHLRDCLDNAPELVRYVGALGFVAEEFFSNVTVAWPLEAKHLSVHSILFATEIYSVLGQSAASLAHEIALHSVGYHSQVLTCEAIPAYQKATGADKLKKKKNAPERPIINPGFESILNGTDAGARSLERKKHLMRNFLFALTNPVVATVYDSEFHPFEFFLEAFAERISAYLLSTVYKPPDPSAQTSLFGGSSEDILSFDLKRPSVYLQEMKAYMAAIRFLDSMVPISCTSAIRDILLEKISDANAREYAATQPDSMVYQVTRDTKKSRGNKPSLINTTVSPPVLALYVAWYSELLGSKATSGTVCFSPNRRAFVSRNQQVLQAETYTDINELSALCEIIGPAGVRFFDEQIVGMIGSLGNSIKDLMMQHQAFLEAFRLNWTDEAKVFEPLKKLKGVKDLTTRAIQLGFIIEFRTILADASNKVFGEKCPHALASVATAYTHFPRTAEAKANPTYQALHALAQDLGIRHAADADVRVAPLLATLMGNPSDAGLWSLLPFLQTAMLYQIAFDDNATYNQYIDGLENNGHCLASAFRVLLSGLRPPPGAASGWAAEKEFLNISSTVLMRLLHRTTDKELMAKQLESAFLVLKRFVQETPAITSGIAETIIPYAVFQIVNGSLHRKRMEQLHHQQKKLPGGASVLSMAHLGSVASGQDEETAF
ncbi:Nck-associated protein 1 [Fimicolochytrium jonesii]|uniref:Nck-associated protein 1 n=1 Tax=Fimicolochytrium jonesii TaxID=1396493 RepID=UPI0022FF01CE|nr:Nck-associated protein 1 [Fimicolochytrium jonesii]KAI8825002.1 Nck-associated protein 1 [Fimicolochytrium jonesii]